jgi:hypothetical protein
MRTLVVAILTGLLLAGSAHAQAAQSLGEKLQNIIIVQVQGIQTLTRMRDETCKLQVSKAGIAACMASYDTLIVRRKAEKQQAEAMLAALNLPASERDKLLAVAMPTFDQTVKDTDALWVPIYQIFPPREKVSTSGQGVK